MEKADKAVEYYYAGFNCAQSVFAVYAEKLGFEKETALKIGTGFGGGARCGQLCGAVSGALMVLGMKYGHFHAGNTDEKSRAYAFTVEFNKRFCKENGSLICRELLGYDLSTQEGFEKIKSLNLTYTLCPALIKSAVSILEKMI